MKKVFGQTARNFKREVNKKVLKVSGIEQKILDATSNEPWGPHGTNLVELAQATRNNHDYQIIMSVIWKRTNDTGKNWRHVFKALTVLEYLVAHGSERVIDEIRDHAYQISVLAEFQYIDSGGRDQGINVRKKSQSLVALLNDKERIREVRKKAQTNKDNYGTPSTGGGYRQSAGGYDDRHDNDHYGNRTDERNGYRDDDRYGRGRNSDERYDRDENRDDNYRSRGNDDNQFRSRSRSVDGYADRSFGDDDRYSSRNGGGKADDQSQDERGLESASYEETTRSFQDFIQDKRNGEAVADSTQNLSSPIAPAPTSSSKNTVQSEETAGESVASQSNAIDTFDEFDPRGSASAVQPAASNPELDIFGFSASDSADPLALVPANSTTSQSDTSANSVFGADFLVAPSSASPASIQTDEDPFGDTPFKAILQENIQAQPQHLQHVTSFQPSGLTGGSETLPSAPRKVETFSSFDFGSALGGLSYAPTDVNGHHASASPSFLTAEFSVEQSNNDILDSILPRTGSGPTFPSQEAQPAAPTYAQTTEINPFQSSGLAAPAVAHGSLTNIQTDEMNPFKLSGELAPVAAQGSSTDTETTAEMNPFQPFGFSTPVASQESPTVAQNLFPPSGLPAMAASQEPETNMHTAQMNPPQQSGLLSPVASEGSPTNMQPSQMNFFQSSGPSASAVSQEPVTRTQTAQMNFSQPSGLSVPAASNMQISQMNFFQPSGQSAPVASQESQMNMQTAQMNFFQPSGLSTTGASQGLNQHMQTDQLNFLQPSGVSAPAGFQGSQTHTQTAQQSFLVPSGLQASAGLQGSRTHTQIARPSFLAPSGLQAPAGLQGSQTHTHIAQPSFLAPSGRQAPAASQGLQTNIQTSQLNFLQPSGQLAPVSSQTAQCAPPTNVQAAQPGTPANMQTANLHIGSQSMFSDPFSSQAATVSVVPTAKHQPSNAKFETKSTVWADTLSRGLVNLDISGPKTNPLADIGVDFDAINRREKRLEPKSSAPPVTSTIHMGKAMGSGSGIGRSAASGLAAPPSPMMGGMGMSGMSMDGGGGMGMRGDMGMGMPGGVGMGGIGGLGTGM